MIEQLLNDVEAAKISVAEWQRKEQMAHDQVQMGRGYLQGLVRALEVAQSQQGVEQGEQKEEAGSAAPVENE